MRRASSGPIRPARRSSALPPRQASLRASSMPGSRPPRRSRSLPPRCRRTVPPQPVRLRGFGAGIGRALTCQCSRIVLPDGSEAILVAATERAGPDSDARRARGSIAGGLRSAGCNLLNRRHAPARDAGCGFVVSRRNLARVRWGSRRWRRMPCAQVMRQAKPRVAPSASTVSAENASPCCSQLSPAEAKRRCGPQRRQRSPAQRPSKLFHRHRWRPSRPRPKYCRTSHWPRQLQPQQNRWRKLQRAIADAEVASEAIEPFAGAATTTEPAPTESCPGRNLTALRRTGARRRRARRDRGRRNQSLPSQQRLRLRLRNRRQKLPPNFRSCHCSSVGIRFVSSGRSTPTAASRSAPTSSSRSPVRAPPPCSDAHGRRSPPNSASIRNSALPRRSPPATPGAA